METQLSKPIPIRMVASNELGHASVAELSPCRKYRYSLERIWDPYNGNCCFIGLNPSTADHKEDDATIRVCTNFAKRWGYGSLTMVNLFAFRATKPKELLTAIDPIGLETQRYIDRAVSEANLIIAAWGAHEMARHRGHDTFKRITRCRVVHCLATTKSNHPRHPLRIPRETKPQPFDGYSIY